MEKDWAERFDDSGTRPWSSRAWYAAILLLAILMFVVSVGWAFMGLSAGLYNSDGTPRALDFAGYVRAYALAFAPMLTAILVGYWASRLGKRRLDRS